MTPTEKLEFWIDHEDDHAVPTEFHIADYPVGAKSGRPVKNAFVKVILTTDDARDLLRLINPMDGKLARIQEIIDE